MAPAYALENHVRDPAASTTVPAGSPANALSANRAGLAVRDLARLPGAA